MARKAKGQSRTAQRAALQAAAAHIQVPAAVDVCVMGGGAAGLVAAITAAEAGARVVVLEHDLSCGRTILATGNGRCNFANEQLDPALYYNAEFVRDVCGTSWLADVLSFFATSGLAWATETQGRMYPLSRQAASVRNVLLKRAARAQVVLAPLREVEDLIPNQSEGTTVRYREVFGERRERTLRATSVIVATGGVASVAGAYLPNEPLVPLLCPLACEGPALAVLDGRRAQAALVLKRDNEVIAREEGEVLFRTYGLSGIAVFNLSRQARAHDQIMLDLLPALSYEQACTRAEHTLDGLLDPTIAQALSTQASTQSEAVALAKNLCYYVISTTETAHAQVRRGGLAVTSFDPVTLSATSMPCLYACGEALNVDGPCGGYNLAWAWKSGMVAGAAAAEGALR